MEHQLVVFELGKEHYAVDISAVESIIKMQAITVVPHTPAFVEGVTNLRGSVLPVIDLRKRFGLAMDEISKKSRIVVIALGKTKVGMIVDAVSEVLRVPDDAIDGDAQQLLQLLCGAAGPAVHREIDHGIVDARGQLVELHRGEILRHKNGVRLVFRDPAHRAEGPTM